ncbi:MAG: TolC family protein [Bacteroidales bacterium]|nr:TolC family protein [Bacteroidales bacterium]
MNNRILIGIVFMLLTVEASAQSLDYNTYIDLIKKQNAEYVSEELNMAIGEAELKAARTVEDPSLSFEYGNNSDWSIAMGQSVSAELSKSISISKLSARVKVAKQQLSVSQASFDDYWRNLKADATIDFYNALLAKELLQVESQAYQNIASLALSDSLRFVKGEITELDMLQSHLEKYRAQQELNGRQTDLLNALVLLDERCGNPSRGTRGIEGRLEMTSQDFDLQQLLDQAFKNRSDLRAAEESVTLAKQEEKLAIRERIPDVELVLGANYNTRVRNEEAPAPPFMGYSVGLTIPLPVLSVNSGVRKASMLRQQQAQLQSQFIRNSIQSEVIRAYNVYQASLQKVRMYNEVLMVSAQQVLDGKLYAYQRGETSLLEVLTAQHTFNEIQKDYATCVYDCMVALVELERSVGW